MKQIGKILLGGGILTAGVAYFFKMKRTSNNIETITGAIVHKLDFSGITIRADVLIKNPSPTKLRIKFPFVKLMYKKATIGSSEVIDKEVHIPAYGQAMIEKIMINIPLSGVFSIGADLIAGIRGSKKGVKIMVKTLSVLNLGWKSLPYEKMDEVILRKEQIGNHNKKS